MYRILTYVRISLTTFLAAVCICGDWLVELNSNSSIAKAIFDNATHACVGLLTALLLFIQLDHRISSVEKNAAIIICGVCSSLIDIDHFIAARSWKLAVCIGMFSIQSEMVLIVSFLSIFFPECHQFATKTVSPLHHNSIGDSDQYSICSEISLQTMVCCDNLCLSVASYT